MSETCAVCKQGKGPEKCEICGFSDNGVVTRDFLTKEDADYWLETTVKPYRIKWEAEKREKELQAQLENAKQHENELQVILENAKQREAELLAQVKELKTQLASPKKEKQNNMTCKESASLECVSIGSNLEKDACAICGYADSRKNYCNYYGTSITKAKTMNCGIISMQDNDI